MDMVIGEFQPSKYVKIYISGIFDAKIKIFEEFQEDKICCWSKSDLKNCSYLYKRTDFLVIFLKFLDLCTFILIFYRID